MIFLKSAWTTAKQLGPAANFLSLMCKWVT